MYGVEIADVGSRDVARLELAAVRAMWGPTRTSGAKEVLWAVLVPGHRVSLVWRLHYSRVLWLARQAQLVGVARAVAAQRATPGPWESGRGMPPVAAVAAVHRFGGTRTAPASHLWGARGGGLQASMYPWHDSG